MTPLLLQYGETSHLKNASSFYGYFCYLHHCNMSPSGQCLFCSEEETCLHLFNTCLWSSSFWSFTNIDIRFSDPCHIWGHRVFLASNVNKNDSSALHYITWIVWKCKYAKVFRHEDEESTHILRWRWDDRQFFSFRPIDVVTPWAKQSC